MPSFEMNRLQSIAGVSALSNAERAKTKVASEGGPPNGDGSAGEAIKAEGVAVEVAAPVQSGPPVDTDRVAEIRSALRNGTYPLVPTKIADAMIAAQYEFESEK